MVPLSMLMRDSLNGDQFEGCKCLMLRFLVPGMPLLSPVLRNNRKVPEPACNCLRSLSNLRWVAATDPRKACYLLNFAKNSQFSGECPGETGSYLTAHTTIQSPQTARFRHDAE
jgi:hypothetical protein